MNSQINNRADGFEFASVGLIVLKNNRVVEANAQAIALVPGIIEGEFFPYSHFLEGIPALQSELGHPTGKPVLCSYSVEGSIQSVMVAVSAKTGTDTEVMTIIPQDDSEGKLSELIAKRTAKLERVNSDLNDFAYVVSHDLKAPLRAIYQLSSWIVDDYGHLFDSDGKEQMGMLCGRVEHMNRLIDGVLLYSRAGKETKCEIIDMNELYTELELMFETSLTMKLQKGNAFPEIWANRTHIQQIFQNIIANAEKHRGDTQGVGVVSITYRDCGQYHRFAVADDGPGIAPYFHKHIFKMFTSLSKEESNSGVGLAIVQKLMVQYDGRVSVDSELGKGATFNLDFQKSVVSLPKRSSDE